MEVANERPRSCFNVQSQALLRFLTSERAGAHLYAHQVDAVLCARRQLLDPREPNIALVVLPTGCGKTGVAVLSAYALNASRVLVITPSVKISHQLHEAFKGNRSKRRPCFLTERGIISEKQEIKVLPSSSCITKSTDIMERLPDDVMVVNAHKIGGKSSVAIDDIPPEEYDLVIVDEAHHYPAPTWKNLVDHFPHSMRLFLTATPRYRGNPILPYPPCYEMPRHEAVMRGIIRPVDFDQNVGGDPANDIAVFMV